MSSSLILVVDDDDDVRSVIGDLLDVLSHPHVAVGSGQAAVEALKGRRFSLAILDYSMPEMTGAEVADALRAVDPELPLLFATAYPEEPELARFHDEAVPVLRKPFRLGELAELIGQRGRPI